VGCAFFAEEIRLGESLESPARASRIDIGQQGIAMSPTSFKKDLGKRPQHYRTPSPPRLDFEPISPIYTESKAHEVRWREGARFYDGINLDSSVESLPNTDWRVPKESHSNTMEAFASIALAITPASQVQAGSSSENPSRRLKRED
jgi:hypothetical protein